MTRMIARADNSYALAGSCSLPTLFTMYSRSLDAIMVKKKLS